MNINNRIAEKTQTALDEHIRRVIEVLTSENSLGFMPEIHHIKDILRLAETEINRRYLETRDPSRWKSKS